MNGYYEPSKEIKDIHNKLTTLLPEGIVHDPWHTGGGVWVEAVALDEYAFGHGAHVLIDKDDYNEHRMDFSYRMGIYRHYEHEGIMVSLGYDLEDAMQDAAWLIQRMVKP